jgi:hypothetical protein
MYQQPESGFSRDSILPWGYDVKDGKRDQSGTWAVPGIAKDIWHAIEVVGSAPLLGAYNPSQRDDMIEKTGAVVGPMAGVGVGRAAMAPHGGSELGIFGGKLAKTADRITARGGVGHVPDGSSRRAIEAKEYILRDPSRIRSVNAAFDPAKKDSANLLAAHASPAPVSREDVDDILKRYKD